MNNKKQILLWIIAILFPLVITCAAIELMTRLAGREPWPNKEYFEAQTLMSNPHPILGWRHKAGTFQLNVEMNFWEHSLGGIRKTQASKQDRAHDILLVGGSFTEGYQVADEDTFGWKLQAKIPDYEFLNFGTEGYGTYQSLLLFEQYLANSDRSPEYLIYGFNDFHADRNVATFDWVKATAWSAIDEGRIAIPYALLDAQGQLKRYPPSGYPGWPLKQYSAALTFLEELYVRRKFGNRDEQRIPVTKQILLEMNRLATQHNTKLLVVIMTSWDVYKLEYTDFFLQEGIWFVDCTHQKWGQPPHDLQVNGVGHPNAKMNEHWANCIEAVLRSDINGVQEMAQQSELRLKYEGDALPWQQLTAPIIHQSAEGWFIQTDVSNHTPQLSAPIPVSSEPAIYIPFALNLINGGVSITLLDGQGRAITQKLFTTPGLYNANLSAYLQDLALADLDEITIVFANHRPTTGSSEFVISNLEVYFPAEVSK